MGSIASLDVEPQGGWWMTMRSWSFETLRLDIKFEAARCQPFACSLYAGPLDCGLNKE